MIPVLLTKTLASTKTVVQRKKCLLVKVPKAGVHGGKRPKLQRVPLMSQMPKYQKTGSSDGGKGDELKLLRARLQKVADKWEAKWTKQQAK